MNDINVKTKDFVSINFDSGLIVEYLTDNSYERQYLLNKNELIFIRLLFKNKNQFISLENVANQIWGSNEFNKNIIFILFYKISSILNLVNCAGDLCYSNIHGFIFKPSIYYYKKLAKRTVMISGKNINKERIYCPK